MFFKKIPKIFYTALILSFIFWIATFALYFLTEKTKADWENLNLEVVKQTSRKEEIKSLSSTVQELEKEILELDTFFVGKSQEHVVNFIEVIEKTASENRVDLIVNSVDVSPNDTNELENLNLQIETRGAWRDTFEFLESVENLPYGIKIGQANLNLIAEPTSEEPRELWGLKITFSVIKLK